MTLSKPIKCLFAAALVCVAFCVCFAAVTCSNTIRPLKDATLPQADNGGWTILLPGGPVSATPGVPMEGVGSSLTVQKMVFPEDDDRDVLVFQNNRQCVAVRAEGETLFQIGGDRRLKMGTSVSCTVSLPEKGRPYVLEVEFFNLNGTCKLPEFSFGTVDDVLVSLFTRDLAVISFLPLWVILGLVLAGLAIVLAVKKIPERRVVTLAAFLLCVVGWNFCELELTRLLSLNMELLNTLAYYFLMLIPITVVFFIQRCCVHRPPRLFTPLLILLLTNILAQSTLFLLGAVSLHQLVMISQGALLFLLFYGVVCSVLDDRVEPSAVGRLQIAAFSLSALMGTLVVLVYWAEGSGGTLYKAMFQATVSVLMTVMLSLLLASVEQQRSIARSKDAQIDAYRAISNVDQLTGLGNRRAFDQRMQEMYDDPERYPDPTLVFMDLNGLKYANDVFGHQAGDELIAAAGRCIRQGFDRYGTSYRVGGDEFAALLGGSIEDAAACCDRMDRAIDEYNVTAEVPLSIARGSCALIDEEGKRLLPSDWKLRADGRMYADKKERRHTRYQGV